MTKVGNWTVHAAELKLVWQDQIHYLEPRAMDLLVFLMERPGEVIPRDTLVDHVWKGVIVSDHAVTSCIAKVRKILHLDTSLGPYIDTISKRGYRLHPAIPVTKIVPVSEWSAPVSTTAAGTVLPSEADTPANIDNTPDDKDPIDVELTHLMIPQRRYQLMIGLFALLCLPVVWLVNQWLKPTPVSMPSQYSDLKPLSSNSGQETSPHISADGQTYAYLQQTGSGWSIVVKQLGIGNPLVVIDDVAARTPSILSNDGNYLLYHRKDSNNCHFMQIGPLRDNPKPLTPQRIAACPADSNDMDYDWDSTRTNIFYTSSTSSNQHFAIFQLNIQTGKIAQLTTPQFSGFGDYRLRLSADDQQLYFLRNHYWRRKTDFMRLDLQTSQLATLGTDNSLINAFDIDQQGRLLYVSGNSKIVRFEPATSHLSTLYSSPIPVSYPVISHDQQQLIFTMMQSRNFDIAVHRVTDMQPAPHFASLNSSRTEGMPTFAHRKKWLAFFSDRSGVNQLYITDFEGKIIASTEFKEALLSTGMLQWTPDDDAVFFYSENVLYRLDIRSNQLSQQRIELPYLVLTGVSADGVSVYFASDHAQDWQVYRFRQGKIEQITQQGGIVGTEDSNGRYFYFSRFHKPEIWRRDLQTGVEELLIKDATVLNSNQMHLSDAYLYYLSGSGGKRALWRYELTSGQRTAVNNVEVVADYGFSISSDGELISLTIPPAVIESDIMQVSLPTNTQ